MNFFAHATVALWRSNDPRFLFGAMLPDLTSMIGLRLAGSSDREVSAGIDFHHATDAAFHGAERFVAMCGRGVSELTAQGVGRGSARAVAHVGTELLLDGALSRDRNARAAYDQALSFAIARALSDSLAIPEASDRQRLHAGLVRLRLAPVPEGYREPSFVVDRLHNILARRPRLALQAGDAPHVRRFIESAHAELLHAAPELLAQVSARLAG